MPTTPRESQPSVMQRLLDEPYRFQFFQAVHLLELCLRRHGVPHDRAVVDYMRFRNSVSLSFPASQIEALCAESDTAIATVDQLTNAMLDKQLDGIAITPTFMGYLGVSGALPNHVTERILAAPRVERTEGTCAFLDVFSTRALALFYAASAKYRVEYKLDDNGRDGFMPLLLELAGTTPLTAANAAAVRGGVQDETLAYYAAVFRQRSATAGAITDVLSDYFGLPFELVPFDGCWDVMSEDLQTSLDGTNAVLGHGAILGPRRWTRDQRVRVRIGPLAKADFNRFCPTGSGAKALRVLLGMFPCAPLRFQLQPILRAQDVHDVRLGPPAPGEMGLGIDTFLVAGPQTDDRACLCYDLNRVGQAAEDDDCAADST
ncbi:type VI secretion system protein ImpH [Rugamonas rubra]|uniref:Type VI secretion system protein ImpH n=2 Tax=Rugamonas rubra TaxID=758825 RepID=A0A1I4JC55_9BURK|nr:type VI secretion system protein ImpH [Rugamonas rubra]